MIIRVYIEENPGIRFHFGGGSSELGDDKYDLNVDTGCGVLITVNSKRRFRLSPESLIGAIHEELAKEE